MNEGRRSGELEGSTLGNSSRNGDGGRRSQRRTLSSGAFLVDSSFIHKSKSLRTSYHRPRLSESDRKEKRGANEDDIVIPKKRSRFPWSRHKDSLGGSSVIEHPPEAAHPPSPPQLSEAEASHEPQPQPNVDNRQAAMGLDKDSLQIVNLALNLSESRRRNNLGRSISTRLSSGGWATSAGQPSVSYSHAPTGMVGLTQQLVDDRGIPLGPRAEPVTNEPSSILSLLPTAAGNESFPQGVSDSTLARADKARRHFELFSEYLRLLPSLPPLKHHDKHDADSISAASDSIPSSRIYNPLQSIRNRKVRFRERRPIDPESGGWHDLRKVREWVDSVEAQYGQQSQGPFECLKLPTFQRGQSDMTYEESDDGDLLAASPPASLTQVSRTSSTKARRPRLDWIISPAELLADAAWVEEDLNKGKILDKDGNLLYIDPTELHPSSANLHTPNFPMKTPTKSDFVDIEQPDSRTSFSDAHPSLTPEFKSVGRGRRRHRFQSPSRALHNRSASMYGMGSKNHKLRARSSSSSSISTKGDRSHWKKNRVKSPEGSGSLGSRASRMKGSSAAPEGDSGIDTRLMAGQSSGSQRNSIVAKLDERRSGSISSVASEDNQHNPLTAVGTVDTISNTHTPLAYFPSIASNFSAPSSRSPSPPRRHFVPAMTPRRERSKSNPRANGFAEGSPLAISALRYDSLPDNADGVHRPGGLEPSPLPDRISSSYQEDQARGHTQKESKLRGIFKGPGKIAKTVGNEVSKMGDLILKKDTLTHSRKSSMEASVTSENGLVDDAEEEKGDKKSGPKALLRRLPTLSDEPPRKIPEKVVAKNLIPSLSTTPSRQGDQDELRKASDLSSSSRQGSETQLLAQELQGQTSATSVPQKKLEAYAPTATPDKSLRFEPELHTIQEQIKKGRIKDPSIPFSLTRPPVTGLAQAKASPAPSDQEKPAPLSGQSRSWSISNRSITTSVDSGVPTKIEVERTRALLLSSGIKAREITRRAESIRCPPPEFLRNSLGSNTPVPRVIRMHEFDLAAQGLLQRFEKSHYMFQQSLDRFPTTSSLLKSQLTTLENKINHSLSPRVRAAADDAENLSVHLNTTSTLAVKQLSDKLDKGIRKRHRRMRWMRRTGFVMLEWALVGMLWWVWLIVMAFKVLRGVFRGAISGVRWVLWP